MGEIRRGRIWTWANVSVGQFERWADLNVQIRSIIGGKPLEVVVFVMAEARNNPIAQLCKWCNRIASHVACPENSWKRVVSCKSGLWLDLNNAVYAASVACVLGMCYASK